MHCVNPEPDEPRTALEDAILDSLDRLLHALTLEPQGEDRFGVASEPARYTTKIVPSAVADRLNGGSARWKFT